jgi:hypothetical protein
LAVHLLSSGVLHDAETSVDAVLRVSNHEIRHVSCVAHVMAVMVAEFPMW